MTVHYQNKSGEEIFIKDVIHLQNVDNHRFIVTLSNGRELTLRTSGIEGVYVGEENEDGKT